MTFSTTSRRLGTLAALALLSATSFAQTVDNKPEVKAQVLDRVNALITKRAYVPGLDLAKWKAFVTDQKTKLDDAKDDNEFAYVINEALTKFGASHMALMTPKATDVRNTNSFVGIGITQQKTEEGTLILRTYPDGPAAKAGLVPGDVIVKVEGQPADGPKGIAGAEGTEVHLSVKRSSGKTDDVTLKRGKFSTIQPEQLTEVDKSTATLTVSTFDLSYDAKNVEALMLKAQKYPNLVLDLRDNGGGAVVNLQHLLGLFTSADKPFGTFVSRRLAKDYVEKTGGQEKDVVKVAAWSRTNDDWSDQQQAPFKNRNLPVYKGHVAVLVNKYSYSAAEICAAALRDLVGAQVVGTKSGGAVLVALMAPASNGFTMEYPFMDYVTVTGQRIEGNGVAPTVEVEDPKYRLANGKDPVIDKAAEVLEKAAAKRVSVR